LGGHTQNANESLNTTVWRLAPKHLHSGLKIIEIAFLAAGIFNEGYSSILRVMDALKLQIGSLAKFRPKKRPGGRSGRRGAAFQRVKRPE